MKKVIVTGGAGFIGSHIVDALIARGFAVEVLDNLSTGRGSNLDAARKAAQSQGTPFTLTEGSIADPKTWERLGPADALFHFAAQTSVTYSVEKPQIDFETNIVPVLYSIQWMRRHQVKHALYANTAGALYGDALVHPTTEDTAPRPTSPYGATKAFFENYLGSLTRSLKDGGQWSSKVSDPNYFTWASLRLSNIYGPRQYPKGEAGVIPIFAEELRAGRQPIIFGTGSNKTRDYTHVHDVAAAFMVAFEKAQSGAIDDSFNVACQVETPDIEVFKEVLKASQARAAKDSAWKAALKVSEPKFMSVRPGEVMRSALSNAKIKKTLGWSPKISFAQGVRETIESYEG